MSAAETIRRAEQRLTVRAATALHPALREEWQAVAALLRREADRIETDDAFVRATYPELAWEALRYEPDPLLLALARAYLREES